MAHPDVVHVLDGGSGAHSRQQSPWRAPWFSGRAHFGWETVSERPARLRAALPCRFDRLIGHCLGAPSRDQGPLSQRSTVSAVLPAPALDPMPHGGDGSGGPEGATQWAGAVAGYASKVFRVPETAAAIFLMAPHALFGTVYMWHM